MTLARLGDRILRAGIFGQFVRAFVKSRHDDIRDVSASIAYFSLLSLFPLLLGVIAVGSLLFDPTGVERRVEVLLANTLPVGANFVSDNIEAVFRLRGAASLLSAVILLWSARKIAGAIDRGLNHALGLRREIPFYRSSIRSLGMTILVSISLLAAFAFAALVEIVPHLDLASFGGRANYVLGFFGQHGSSVVVGTIVLTTIYRLVPRQRPQWRDALFGALIAAMLLECCKAAFAVYLRLVGSLQAVYGSVSSIIVLLLWLYYSARVVLFGAELISVRRSDRDAAKPLEKQRMPSD